MNDGAGAYLTHSGPAKDRQEPLPPILARHEEGEEGIIPKGGSPDLAHFAEGGFVEVQTLNGDAFGRLEDRHAAAR